MDNIDDKGVINERELIELFYPQRKAKQTISPNIEISDKDVSVDVVTDGSRIGYRYSSKKQPSIGWIHYKEPIALIPNDTLEIIAHRIGYKSVINKIYNDPSMLINELRPDAPTTIRFDSTFDEDFRRLAKANVFKPGWEKKTRSMYNLVVLKDMISSLIWYFLTTALIVATSFNGIMNINCIRSEETLSAGKLLGSKLGAEALKDGKAIKGGATKLKDNL